MCARIPDEVMNGFPKDERPEVSHYGSDGLVIAEIESASKSSALEVVDELESERDSETEHLRGRYQWNSRQFDSDTALTYNRVRCYDPTTGRWLSGDPLGFDAGKENVYPYHALAKENNSGE